MLLADGGVAVAGITHSPDAQDFTAIRLGANGNQVWIRELMGSSGFVENESTGLDGIVVRIAGHDGSEVWRQEYDSPGTGTTTPPRRSAPRARSPWPSATRPRPGTTSPPRTNTRS